ncbi:MAG: hypothetical protein IMW99_09325 [Firmicutes bacterium]|nr:hypothetical protein [Bacillota bacterium]
MSDTDMQSAGVSDGFNVDYWQKQVHKVTQSAPGGEEKEAMSVDAQEVYRPECVIVEKVYNECAVCDCRPFRLTNIAPAAASVSSCEVVGTPTVVDASIPRDNEVSVTIEWTQRVEYMDVNNQPQEAVRNFRVGRRVTLNGAVAGMTVRVLPLVQCLNCHVIENGSVIECEVGYYIVVKITALVQLEIAHARFCPPPSECVGVSPFGCPDWAEMCETNAFWPPWPPQPVRR